MELMIDAFVSGWQRTFDYEGRSSRADYWWFVLANILLAFILAILGNVSTILLKLLGLYSIASVLPSISLVVRRLRDAGKHWAWGFIGFVPLIGGIWLIVLLVQPSLGSGALPM